MWPLPFITKQPFLILPGIWESCSSASPACTCFCNCLLCGLQWSHVKMKRRKPWRHLLLLTHSSAWSALTLCPWNNTTVRYTAQRLTLHNLSAHEEGEDAPAVPLYIELCDSGMLFLDALNSLLLFFIKSVCAPHPSSPDLITISGWCHHCFSCSGDCVSRGDYGSCWWASVALSAHRAACCTASVKETGSVSSHLLVWN